MSVAGTATGPRFALEHIGVEDGHVVVRGRWHNVTGRRFVRPALHVDGRRRVMATLEHKPWAPAEGELWVAAFPAPSGDFASVTLEVAPDVVVDLTPGARPPRGTDSGKAAAVGAAKEEQLEARRRAEREREDLRSRLGHMTRLRDEAVEERDAALRDGAERERRAREAARAETERLKADADDARRNCDAMYLRAVRAERALEEARSELARARNALAEWRARSAPAPAARRP